MVYLKNWRDIVNGVAVVLALCSAYVSLAAETDSRDLRNQEYRFSVTFPRDVQVCPATSGGQPHGFFARLTNEEIKCDDTRAETNISVISMYAYSNTTFERSPEDEIEGLCRAGTREDGDSIEGLNFPGRRSAQCRVQGADGSIDIYVVTQAGRWPVAQDSQDLTAPYINYTASLHTTENRFPEDLARFRDVLGSVRIEYEE
jgi:hypothetical protein